MKFNIICASHKYEILKKNLGASLSYKNNPVNIACGFNNVSEAYNSSHKSCGQWEYNIYAHHDVYLPDSFDSNLTEAISEVNKMDPNWGVLGVAGATIENGQRRFYGHVNDRGKEWGTEKGLPREVQTLDELLLITKGDFVFDEQFDLHFYGADICLQAIKQGRKNYVIDAYVCHNSSLKPGERTDSFRECEAKFKEKWRNYLPIATTCSLL